MTTEQTHTKHTHTPGPWKVDHTMVRHGKDLLAICQVYNPEEGAQLTANACLIAAAPDLYREACLISDGLSDMIESGRLSETYIPDDYQWVVERLLKLNDAIAKAENRRAYG